MTRRPGGLAAAVLAGLTAGAAPALAQRPGVPDTIVIRNNHGLPYRGPVEVRVALPDGSYGGGAVRDGVLRASVSLPAGGSATLVRGGPDGRIAGDFGAEPDGARLDLRDASHAMGTLELGLALQPGATATVDDAVRGFAPLPLAWRRQADGTLQAETTRSGYLVRVTAAPASSGALDVRARLERVDDPAGPAYIALVRRVTTPGVAATRLRFNGRVLDGADSPDDWERDFWYTRGVDWLSWTSGGRPFVAVNGFTPVPTIRRGTRWGEGSHFYVWERTRRTGDTLYLVSEVAGPNPGQARSRYMPVTPSAPLRQGDAVELRWRLAAATRSDSAWEESQLRVFAGYRRASPPGSASHTTTVDLGVPGVAFGTSYFPYSTFAENFDFYRTPGLNSETWWPISATMWRKWRAFRPRMRTDLHIIRAMGFSAVRLHHLELLQRMDRREALGFLDWFVGEVHGLGMTLLVDSEGPPAWVAEVLGRYRDVVTRYEIENEILIGGVKPGDAERWTALYRAAKQAAPGVQAFLTTAGNHGQFERLRALGVPFDRVGLHAYKHGAPWMESFSSSALGSADYARELGTAVTLGEFNWKELTRLSPTARTVRVAALYRALLEPRALPEIFEFHFQETMSVNTVIARNGTRHYEPVMLDRRPKPEARVLMDAIRAYALPGAPVRDLPVTVRETRFARGRATTTFTVQNRTARPLTVRLEAVAFDGTRARLTTPATLTLAPDESREGRVDLRLPAGALPGTYHHFVAARYHGATSWGWGVAGNEGVPTFDAPVLGDRVRYPQGAGVVRRVDWTRPLAVTFATGAPVLEMETAYTVANTLQAATGRPVWLSSAEDLPDSLARDGTVIAVARDSALGSRPPPPGIVRLERPTRLLLIGATKEAVQAAANDVVLRCWPHAKDAAMRVTGLETGALLGNRIGPATAADLP